MIRPHIHPFGLVACCLLFHISCTRQDKDPVPAANSKKLKSIIFNITGNRQVSIVDLAYDGSDRLIQYNQRTEDLATTPARVLFSASHSLSYNGSNEYPSKNITTMLNGDVDSTVYYYDVNARVILDEHYHLGNKNFRNEYVYVNPNFVLVSQYKNLGLGLELAIRDSVYFDSENKITQQRQHSVAANYALFSNYTYDNKINPRGNISAFKHIFTLNGSELNYYLRSPANYTHFHVTSTTAYTLDHVVSYVYDAEGYPVSDAGHKVSTNPTIVQDYTTRYEYY
jgi:hypothetical protein